MPIYAYKCADCGHAMDVIRKVSDPLLADCPNCGKPALVKQVTAAGFHLKGAGWYVTDFRDGGKKKDGKPDEKAKTDQAADGKSDVKPDPKSDTADSKTAAKTDTKTETKTESKSEPASKPAPAPPAPPKTGSSGTS